MANRFAIEQYNRAGPAVAADGPALPAGGQSLIETAWRRRWTVAAVTILCVAGAFLYCASATRVYSAYSRLYVQQNGPRLLAQGADPGLTQSDAYLFRQCEVIKAEPILKQAIAASEDEMKQTFAGVNDAMGLVHKNLGVAVGKKDEIITISFDSPYPDEAAVLVNSIVAAYRSYATDTAQSSAAGMLKVLRGEKEKQEKLLDDKLKQVVAFKQANGEMFFNTDRGTNILLQNLATISDQLTRARLAATSAYAAYESASNRPLAFKQWSDLQRQALEYEHLFETEKAKALKINDAQAEFSKLQVEADRTTKLCDLLDSRIKEISVTEDSGAMNIQVLEAAKAEQYPTSPKRTIIVLAAMAVGLGLGCAAAVAHETLDQRVREPDESGQLLGLPVLGTVPIVRHAVAAARKQLGRAVHLAPNSDVADAYRMLRAAVYYGWPNREAKSVVITSPTRGDGKSTTASNLAIAMAQAGIRTLLIDADLRAAVQHRVFGVSNTTGLSDIIAHGVAVEHTLRKTEIDSLVLLPSGTPTTTPAEVTNGQAFAKLLQQLETDYDLVVIDSPPLLDVADARILGAQAGLTILTVRADKSTRQDVRQACQQLLGVGSSILGVVVNGVSRGRRAYAGEYRSDEADVPPGLIEPNLAAARGLPTGNDPGAHALTY